MKRIMKSIYYISSNVLWQFGWGYCSRKDIKYMQWCCELFIMQFVIGLMMLVWQIALLAEREYEKFLLDLLFPYKKGCIIGLKGKEAISSVCQHPYKGHF